ncbi:FAD/NAD(P)-binding domain-containing protein [Dendrothele bispora CBS 962.96]|uniref:FAD/NAD(P)-binding domain-containing protein n=1 Tax=Dendrothele bispora (strain CBS 962.96) TaxID=1314807 RepID=A0A4S8MSX3_DENBC|nr:FAD/NAD(P)-binding domain-containing protein [Dendrothele bispora CBS 962.96]
MTSEKPNVVVIGGSYVGSRVVDLVAPRVYKTHNVVMIEKSSHFQNQFIFPRMHAVQGFEHKAFIPFTGTFFRSADLLREELGLPKEESLPSESTKIVQGFVDAVYPKHVSLESGEKIPYEYLVVATGTGQPGSMKVSEKKDNVERWRELQKKVQNAEKIVVVGAGAYGIQLVTDLKTYQPTSSKHVTLVHSRQHLMNRFHSKLHEIVLDRLGELGIDVVLGKRVVVPEGGFPNDEGKMFNVELVPNPNVPAEERSKGSDKLEADLVILCTSATPSSSPLRTLAPDAIIPDTGYIRVKPTLQVDVSPSHLSHRGASESINGDASKHSNNDNNDDVLSRVFAVGDVAHTGAHKAARPGYFQAEVLARNIEKMIKHQSTSKLEKIDDLKVEKDVKEQLEDLALNDKDSNLGLKDEIQEELELEEYSFDPPGIHLYLGLDKGIIFRDPRRPTPENQNPEPTWSWDSGSSDLEINTQRLWDTRASGVKDWYA